MANEDYFCIENTGPIYFEVKFSISQSLSPIPVLEASTDLTNWFPMVVSETSVGLQVGDKLYIRGDNASFNKVWNNGQYVYVDTKNYTDARFKVSGNIISLVDKTCQRTSIPTANCFSGLFTRNKQLEDASELFLSFPTLSERCYFALFYDCDNLIYLPTLASMNLAPGCYSCMFCYCYLRNLPELPATTLASSCYASMFSDTYFADPDLSNFILPATTLASACYHYMFEGCRNLKIPPELPATTLAEHCYYGMFMNCSALTTAPELPALTAPRECYSVMFDGCTSLLHAPELPATTLGIECYYNIFAGCTSLITAPALPATTLVSSCYWRMFGQCTSLTTPPELPATTLASSCYSYMFDGCTSLQKIPDLSNITSLNTYSCREMFYGCTSLEYLALDALPKVSRIPNNCYQSMFEGCTSLKIIPWIPSRQVDDLGCEKMFYGCSNIKLGLNKENLKQIRYKIPFTTDCAIQDTSFQNMFTNTGGSWSGTPEALYTYYLDLQDSDFILIDLTEYQMSQGEHEINVTVNKAGYSDSDFSNTLIYTKE